MACGLNTERAVVAVYHQLSCTVQSTHGVGPGWRSNDLTCFMFCLVGLLGNNRASSNAALPNHKDKLFYRSMSLHLASKLKSLYMYHVYMLTVYHSTSKTMMLNPAACVWLFSAFLQSCLSSRFRPQVPFVFVFPVSTWWVKP